MVGFIWRSDAEQESGIIIEYMRMPLPVCGDGDHRGGGQFFFFLFWKKPNFHFLLFFAKGPGPVTPVRWSIRQPTTAETRRHEQVIFLYNRSTPMSTVALYKKKKKTRIDHFEINWKWHPVINWQNLEKRKRKKIWRLIEAGGHVSARLGSTQSEQTPMISSSQEWEKRKLGRRRRRRTDLTRTDRLGVLYGIILEVLRRDYCHAAAERKKKKRKRELDAPMSCKSEPKREGQLHSS